MTAGGFTYAAGMRAAVVRDWQLRVDDVPEPTPGPGQVLAKVLACGICGSDLHLLRHGREQREISARLSESQPPDPVSMQMFEPSMDMVMGHEFCCEVVELGPDVDKLAVRDVVVSMPIASTRAAFTASDSATSTPAATPNRWCSTN